MQAHVCQSTGGHQRSASCLLPHCASSAPAWCSGPAETDVQIYAGRPACCCTVQGMHMLHQQLQKSCHPEEGCRTPCLWSCLVQGGRISSALATQGNLRPRQVHCLCRTCLLLALRRCRCSSSTLSASSVLVAGLQGCHCEQAYRRRGGAEAHWGKCTLGHVGTSYCCSHEHHALREMRAAEGWHHLR